MQINVNHNEKCFHENVIVLGYTAFIYNRWPNIRTKLVKTVRILFENVNFEH